MLAWTGSCEPQDESCSARWLSLELAAEQQKAHSEAVRSIHFSADSKRIVSGSDDKSIAVWDAGICISREARPSLCEAFHSSGVGGYLCSYYTHMHMQMHMQMHMPVHVYMPMCTCISQRRCS